MVGGWSAIKRSLQVGFAIAVLTAIICFFVPNYFLSETKVLPVEQKGIAGSLGNLASAAAAFGVGLPGGEGPESNFPDIVNSRWMREHLLDTTFVFRQQTWRLGHIQEYRTTLRDYLKVKNPDQQLEAVGRLINTSRDTKSKILTISAETRSPELSKALVDRTTNLLETFVQGKGRTRGSAKAIYAEQRLNEAKAEYSQFEEEMTRFLDVNRNAVTSMDPSIRLRSMRMEAELKLRQQLVATLAMSREQALMEEKNDIPILNILDPANLPYERSKPARGKITIAAFILGVAATWCWLNRVWLQSKLMEQPTTEPRSPQGALPWT